MKSAHPRRPNFDPSTLSWIPLVGGALVLILLATVLQCLLVVPAGARAVVFNSLTGLKLQPLGEGLHLLLPVIETPILYDVRTQTYTMASQRSESQSLGDDALKVLSADGQQITLDVSVRFRLDPAKVSHLHQTIGPSYVDKVIRPEVRTVMRNELALHRAIAVFSEEREEIQENVEQQLSSIFAENDLILQNVLLRNVRFSDQFQTAIEQKQIAEQEKERERFLVEKAELEKQRVVVLAEGEAQSIQLQGEALKQNPEVVQLDYVRKLAPGTRAIISRPEVLTDPLKR
ncbi:prohibitin family protein [Synechococcus sp. Nb3U1]|uniref:prohibitin family protein n=1 Tax=Synechococcus sp. Nb3U1 TaxID=1914529 RepID=UPI001F2EA869|nr:prohibitin family protein [Synechococcus sp. Nb3U1]MCF2972020.1 prohibitin family protein [Synechococcus sp. Nb3U1]